MLRSGGDNNLIVILHSFDTRNVLCSEQRGPSYASCNQLLSSMATDFIPRAFGKQGDPLTQIVTPMVIESRTSLVPTRCDFDV